MLPDNESKPDSVFAPSSRCAKFSANRLTFRARPKSDRLLVLLFFATIFTTPTFAFTLFPVMGTTKADVLQVDNDSDGIVDPGDTIRFTVALSNTGSGQANTVLFADTPDTNTTLVNGSVTTTQGTVTKGNAGEGIIQVSVGDIAPAAGATITYDVVVKNPFPIGITQICNQGLTSGANFADNPSDDPDTGTANDATCTPITALPSVLSTKDDALQIDLNGDGDADAGDTLRYTVVITNSGDRDASSVAFADTVGSNTTLVAGSVTTTQGSITLGNTAGDGQVGVTAGLLAGQGGSVTITFDVVIGTIPSGVTEVCNQGAISGANFSSINTDDPGTGTAGDATCTQVNASPVLVDDLYGTLEDRLLAVSAPGVLANDLDGDGDTLTATLNITTTNGTLTFNTDGSFEYEPNPGFTGSDTFTYSATDGITLVGPVTATISINADGTVPVASVRAAPDTGIAPVDILLDASASTVEAPRTIVSYRWDFGDGSSDLTSGVQVTHTYTTSGTFIVRLSVVDDQGVPSNEALQAIRVGDAFTGDPELLITKSQIKVDWNGHRTGLKRDKLILTGFLNPNGLPSGGGTFGVQLRLNKVLLNGQVSRARAKRRRAGLPRAGDPFISFSIKENGQYKLTAGELDLRSVLGVENETVAKQLVTDIEVTIEDPSVKTARAQATIQQDFKSSAGKSAAAGFNFIKLRTLTGAFKSLRTKAIEQKDGGHKVIAIGPIVGDTGVPAEPIGDITIRIGGDGASVLGEVIVIPFAALKKTGSGSTSVFLYSKKLGLVDGLLKFKLDNRRKQYVLVTNRLTGTGVPDSTSSLILTDMPIQIEFPVEGGSTLFFDTTVELKRRGRTWRR